MSFFDFNIDLLTKRLLPVKKRETVHFDWLSVLLFGIKQVYNDFIAFRSETLTELSYNSQTLILQRVLNDRCDPIDRGIFIDNTFDNKVQKYIFTKAEGVPLHIFTKAEAVTITLYNSFEFENDFDFIVNVPIALTDKEDKIASITNFYKFSGVRFKIVFYS